MSTALGNSTWRLPLEKLVCLAGVALGAIAPGRADVPLPQFPETLAAQERTLAKLALEGWWNGRDGLLSGMVTVRRQSREGPPVGNPQFLAFDRGRSLVRFDATFSDSTFRCAKTPSETLIYRTGIDVIERQLPNYTAPSEDLIPFELRLIGAISLGEFDLRLTLERFADYLAKTTCQSCRRLPDQSIELQLEYTLEEYEQRLQRVIVFRPSQDFVPVELRRGVLSSPSTSALKPGPMDVVKTRWEQKNGVWVPAEAVLEDLWLRRSATLRFDWSGVNQPVAARCFTPEGFDAPPETAILECRLGTPILEGRLGTPRQIDRVNMQRESQ